MSNLHTYLGELPGGVPQRRKPDLGELWSRFKTMQNNPELKEWQRKVYVPGQQQKISDRWVEGQVEQQLYDHEKNY